MRLKPANSAFLFAVCCMLTAPSLVHAQEERSPLEVEALRNEPDPVSVSESEMLSNGKTVTAPATSIKETLRDSAQVKPVKSIKAPEKILQKEEGKVQQKEEDPLSFNFLYYIIEKFKLSDIIE